MRLRIILVAAATLLGVSPAKAEDVPLPVVHVGDTYHFRSGSGDNTRTVTGVGADGTITIRITSGAFNFDLRTTKELQPYNGFSTYNGTSYLFTFNPPACYMPPAPWTVGKEWTCTYTSTSVGAQHFQSQFVIHGKLIAMEKITVPAGTFDALRLSEDLGSRVTYWYAPSIHYYVKGDAGGPAGSFELVSYKIK